MTNEQIIQQLDESVGRIKAFLAWKPEDVEVIGYSLSSLSEFDYIQTYGGRLRELAEKAGVAVTERRLDPEVGGGEVSAVICGCNVVERVP